LRWNQQPATYSIHGKLPNDHVQKAEFSEAVANPSVIHYLGKNKPWNYMTFHPLKSLYWHYLDQTPWHGEICRGKTPLNILRRTFMVEKHWKEWRRSRSGPRISGPSRTC
jgi:lipopolysaccharide biosynthesis glycosyltransferase